MKGPVVPLQVGGVELLVQTTAVAGTEHLSTRVDRAGEAVADAFERAQSAILAVASSRVDTIGQLGKQTARPQQVQVKFGLKFTAKGNVIVAEASGEATLEVTLTYDGTPAPAR
jgi:hypothetical protein